jgi:hypothetical protein
MSVRRIRWFPEMLLNPVEGLGAMTEWRDVVRIVVDRFSLHKTTVEPGGS